MTGTSQPISSTRLVAQVCTGARGQGWSCPAPRPSTMAPPRTATATSCSRHSPGAAAFLALWERNDICSSALRRQLTLLLKICISNDGETQTPKRSCGAAAASAGPAAGWKSCECLSLQHNFCEALGEIKQVSDTCPCKSNSWALVNMIKSVALLSAARAEAPPPSHPPPADAIQQHQRPLAGFSPLQLVAAHAGYRTQINEQAFWILGKTRTASF